MQWPERMHFLADLMKHLTIPSLEPQGKRRAFVSGNEDLRLKPGMRIEPMATGLNGIIDLGGVAVLFW